MFHRPVVDLNLDKDSAADPLNPTVNYTHWQPSPEQRDPAIPLGFKIYGIGCLVVFVGFLIFVVVYVFYKEIKHYIHSSRGEDDEEFLHAKNPSMIDTCHLDFPVSPKTLLDKSDYDAPAKPSRVIPSGHPCLGISGPQEASLLEPSDTVHNEPEEKEHPFLKHAQSPPKGILKTSPTYIARPRGLFTPDDPVSPFEITQETINNRNTTSSSGLPSSQETHIVHLSPAIHRHHKPARRVSISVPGRGSLADDEQPSGTNQSSS
ncbi:hypothetical protein JOM56_008218 [Amanita muscaria]